MADRPVDFYLYRMIVDHGGNVFGFMGQPAQGDNDLIEILRRSVGAELDVTKDAQVNQYKYSAREFVEYDSEGVSASPIVGLSLARSVVQQQGPIVTDTGIITGTSTPDPPIATATKIIFFMERHIAAVGYNGSMMDSQMWRASLHDIFDGAAKTLDISSSLRLEPIPKNSEVMEAFRSFSLLTRLKVHLKLPNPELSRYTKSLFTQMREGGIRDFLQDMRNSEGLSQQAGKLPYAAVAMADAGYKEGEVHMEGMRNGHKAEVTTGQSAAKVQVSMENVREFVRGTAVLAKTQEGKALTKAILDQINRESPPPQADDGQDGEQEEI